MGLFADLGIAIRRVGLEAGPLSLKWTLNLGP